MSPQTPVSKSNDDNQGKETTMPLITCENCHHKQSQETTNNAVLASLMVLHSYFLAILVDLETQFGTIRGREMGIVVCFLGAGSLLSVLGMGFWLICLMLPWVLGCWEIWWCARRLFENLVTRLADSDVSDIDKGNLKDDEVSSPKKSSPRKYASIK